MNIMKKKINSRILVIILFVISFILIAALGTYAWFTWRSNDNDNTSLTMRVGELASITFNNGPDIEVDNLVPVYNYTDGESSSITITSIGVNYSEIKYSIILNIDSLPEELQEQSFRYALTSNNSLVAGGDFSSYSDGDSIYIIDTMPLTSNEISYDFYIYIDGNMYNNDEMMNQSFSGELVVEIASDSETASQKITNIFMQSPKDESYVTNNNIQYLYASSVSMMRDRFGSANNPVDSGNIRYFGSSPDNYIYFNCDDYSDTTTCEVWRIIGVFDDKLKIMRDDEILKVVDDGEIIEKGQYSWDSSLADDNNGYGYNSWDTSDINYLLNPNHNDLSANNSLYWNNSDGNCYSDLYNGTKPCNFYTVNSGIKNEDTKDMIYNSTWYTGLTTSGFANVMYSNEILSNWTGPVGLPSISDYAYAMNFIDCTTTKFSSTACKDSDWMKPAISIWTITGFKNNVTNVFYIKNDGSVGNAQAARGNYSIKPAVFLDPDVLIVSGDGTQDYPYVLSF